MLTVADQIKEDTSIIIDGIRFVRVHFRDCQLIYEARDETDFEDCTFERVNWTFAEGAGRMIAFGNTECQSWIGRKEPLRSDHDQHHD